MTLLELNPIVGGPDQQPRFDEACARARQHFDERTADLRRAKTIEEASIRLLDEAFTARWGRDGGDRRRIDDALTFEREGRLHRQARHPHLNRITTINGELEQLPGEQARTLARIAENLIDGPNIHVPAFTMPAVEQDPQLVALTAERDRAELQRTALMVDRDTFYRLVQEADRLAADVDVRVRHGVAAKGEQAAARKAQTDSQAVHHRTIVDIDDLTAMMDRVDLQIAERRAVVQGEHDHRLAREVEEAAFAAADSLFSAMAQMTRLRRALHASGIGAWWVMKTLNADDDRSTGRQFLQQCMEHGWMPEENR